MKNRVKNINYKIIIIELYWNRMQTAKAIIIILNDNSMCKYCNYSLHHMLLEI